METDTITPEEERALEILIAAWIDRNNPRTPDPDIDTIIAVLEALENDHE